MKNYNYFPFERNKYFYGKLLTEQNFIQEQKYFNNKRRMLNRFLHGEGVVAGLNVVVINDKAISIEAGIALDFAGREIVLETPVNKNLSMIDEFDNAAGQSDQEYVYLCIEYDEKETEPTHNIANSGVFHAEHVDYDKTKEGYHLYITESEPEYTKLTPESLYERKVLLYKEKGIQISQVVPRFIKSKEEFETEIIIENLGSTKKLNISIAEQLECALYKEERFIILEEEVILERFSKITKTFSCKALGIDQGEVQFKIEAQKFGIFIDGETQVHIEEQTIEIPLAKEDFYEELLTYSVRNYMEELVWNNEPRGIYLARIYLIRTGKTYMIDKIDTMPFGQYVYNSQLSMSMLNHMKNELLSLKGKNQKESKEKNVTNVTQTSNNNKNLHMTQGKIDIDLGIGGKKGQRYITEEIYHGLGLLPVQIQLNIQKDDIFYSGSSEVFLDMPVMAEMAVKQDKTKGSFYIGLRLLEACTERKITILWTALANLDFVERTSLEQKLYIKPNLLELKVRESYHLEAVYKNGYHTGVIWRVVSEDGGTISRDGLYTAPNHGGVFEVTAQIEEDENLRTSLFVVVRE